MLEVFHNLCFTFLQRFKYLVMYMQNAILINRCRGQEFWKFNVSGNNHPDDVGGSLKKAWTNIELKYGSTSYLSAQKIQVSNCMKVLLSILLHLNTVGSANGVYDLGNVLYKFYIL